MSRFMDVRYASLEPYTPGEQPRDRKYIKLNTNESPYPPSPRVAEAINAGEIDDLRLYSDPTARDLYGAIARYYGLQPSQVIAGNGSDEILAFAFLAFCGQKGVAFPAVSYGFYPVFAELFGVKARAVPLKKDFSIDAGDYLLSGENVVIANPNAPTGIALPLNDIERILQAHPNDVVLIDEAYVDFGAQSAVSLIDRYDNLLVVQTFSKSRSLAGGRIGFGLAQQGIIQDLMAVRYSFNPYNQGRLPLLAARAAMVDREYFDGCRGKVIATRERTKRELRQLGCDMTESLANFLFVKLPNVSGECAYNRLKEMGILVRWFNRDGIRDYLRITIGADAEMDALIRAIHTIIEEAEK
ncbi:MAG: histidinol-phosphate transaminase [Clostridia bacterium]|nr:histidinol-phosphate transaminase [Clostridia bacterium]